MSNDTNTLPALVNMLTCDGAHQDPGSKKWTLLGLFSSIRSASFPIAYSQLVVYLGVKGMQGNIPVRLQIVASDRPDEPISKVELGLSSSDPRFVGELVVPLRNVHFTKPGEYLIQVYANNHFLGERSIIVVAMERQGA